RSWHARPSPWPSTYCLAPVPIATSITTAATPITTPSLVSRLRSRFARSAVTATRHASPRLMAPARHPSAVWRVSAPVAPAARCPRPPTPHPASWRPLRLRDVALVRLLRRQPLPEFGAAVAQGQLAGRAGGGGPG